MIGKKERVKEEKSQVNAWTNTLHIHTFFHQSFSSSKVLVLVATLVEAAPQNKGKYTHDPAGDTALPYKHDGAG